MVRVGAGTILVLCIGKLQHSLPPMELTCEITSQFRYTVIFFQKSRLQWSPKVDIVFHAAPVALEAGSERFTSWTERPQVWAVWQARGEPPELPPRGKLTVLRRFL